MEGIPGNAEALTASLSHPPTTIFVGRGATVNQFRASGVELFSKADEVQDKEKAALQCAD